MNMHTPSLFVTGRTWASHEQRRRSEAGIRTGFDQLDVLMPEGGFSQRGICEIVTEHDEISALQLVLPVLAELSRGDRWVALIAPPYIPYAPALAAAGVDLSRLLLIRPRSDADGLAVVERALRAGNCAAVLAWPMLVDPAMWARLQLAAEAGDCCGLMFRVSAGTSRTAPLAPVRLSVTQDGSGMAVSVKKRRGMESQRVYLNQAELFSRQASLFPALEDTIPVMREVPRL